MASTKNPCSGSNCSNMVAERRPSETGTHWCPSSACQAEKQRYFRARRNQKIQGTVIDQAVEFVTTLLTQPRLRCGVCGHESAIPGYAHPDPRPDYLGNPCFQLGANGPGIGKIVGAAYRAMEESR